MLPVKVRIVSSSSCTLSEASALLQRFLSSDACSDSLARDYVVNVAHALQDSICRRSGGPESTGKRTARLQFPTPSESPPRSSKKLVDVKQSIFVAGNSDPSSPHSKLRNHGTGNLLAANKLVPSGLGDEKQSLPFAEDVDAVRSVTPEAEHAFERHKKKRRHSAVENGLETNPWHTSEMEDSALMHHDKKRRKKEKDKTGTENSIKEQYHPDDQKHHNRKRSKEKQGMETEKVEMDHLALDNHSSDGKKKRKKEKHGNDAEDMEALHISENTGSPVFLSHTQKKAEVYHTDANNGRVSITPMSGTVEELVGSLKRKPKEGKTSSSATPVKVLSRGKEREETNIEASPLEFENPASDEKNKTKKKRRRKEELDELVRQL